MALALKSNTPVPQLFPWGNNMDIWWQGVNIFNKLHANPFCSFPMDGSCRHDCSNILPSENVKHTKYNLRTSKQLQSAATVPQKWTNDNGGVDQMRGPMDVCISCAHGHSDSFPAPLVLPGDDLDVDSKYPPQSVRSWMLEQTRNRATPERNTIYIRAPPIARKDASFVRGWECPDYALVNLPERVLQRPKLQDVIDYLFSFYNGLPIKRFKAKLHFSLWQDETEVVLKSAPKPKEASLPKYIGLATSKECFGIRVRECQDGLYPCQLNLNDLLDVAIDILPDDAYALLLLVDHDLYEDEDDDFACGRAYGGSRVAVVSSARYHPDLDSIQNVERTHAWPASHCSEFLKDICRDMIPQTKKAKIQISSKVFEKRTIQGSSLGSHGDGSEEIKKTIPKPLQCAISAYNTLPSLDKSTPADTLTLLWLSRICRTAAHELGHCFGIDHCVYYACCMQGTTSLTEDVRQPPYLCPVDLTKVLLATGSNMLEHYKGQLKYCEKYEDKAHMFKAYAEWLRRRLEVEDVQQSDDT